MSSPSSNERVRCTTVWQFADLSDEELETADLVAMNITVARGIPALARLDVLRYVTIVNDWTARFSRWLPTVEPRFHQTPEKWKNDLHFFRLGMLQGFLGHYIGIEYIEEHKRAKSVSYTDPSELFLNGVIDSMRGTCGSMATLHVAIARRVGWPVSLACAGPHWISRFDDGVVCHNIEATHTNAGSFSSGSDAQYIEQFKLSKRAVECGSDLRKLTAREMLGLFISARGRHYTDIDRPDLANPEFCLARVFFPTSRKTYIAAMLPTLHHGTVLFDPHELGHPNSIGSAITPFSRGAFGRNDCVVFGGTQGMTNRDVYVTSVRRDDSCF